MEESHALQKTQLLEKDYISEYMIQVVDTNIETNETRPKKYLRITINLLSVFIGLSAGAPWVYSGYLFANKVSAPYLAYVFGAGLIISYGITAGWGFSEITKELLNPTPKLAKKIRSSSNARYKTFKHTTCHVFGLATVVPAIYIAVVYNTGDTAIPFAVLSSFVTYVFSTFGFYKLFDYTANSLKWLAGKQHISEQAKFASGITTLVRYLDSDIKNYEKLNCHSSTQRSSTTIMRLLDEAKQHYETHPSPRNKGLEYAIKCLLLTTIPTLVTMFRVMVTYMALSDVTDSKALDVIGTILVNTPLYGLVLFAMLNLSKNTSNKVASILEGQQQPKTYIEKGYRNILFLLLVLSFLLSVTSAIPNGFVAENEMRLTVFNPAAILFGIAAFLNAATFQTIGCMRVAGNFLSRFDAWFGGALKKRASALRNGLTRFSEDIRHCKASCFQVFKENHSDFFKASELEPNGSENFETGFNEINVDRSLKEDASMNDADLVKEHHPK